MLYNKVAFVNPPTIEGSSKMIRTFDCNTESKGNYLYQPYDFVLLSGFFPRETEITFIDAVAQELNKEKVYQELIKEDPEVFFVVIGENLFSFDLSFLEGLRNKFNERPIIVFGASFVERKAQKKVEHLVDGILHNPLDFDLASIKRTKIGLIEGRGFVVDESPFVDPKRKGAKEIRTGLPRHELFISHHYRWPFSENLKYTSVFISWGCPYTCSYCILNSFPNLYRPAEEVFAELKSIKSLGLKEVYFADRSFGLPRDIVRKVLTFMIDEKLNLRWSSYFHPNQYDPELLELMAQSGCHTIIIGIEDSNFKSLKNYGRHQKEDKFWSLLKDCKRLRIKVCGDFILGLPGQSRDDIKATLKFSRQIGIDFASYNIAAPLPGSIIKKEALKSGQLKDGDDMYDSLAKYKALSNGPLSGEELVRLRNKAVIHFYLRPLYLLKRLFSIRSLEQFRIQFEEMIQIVKKVSG